MPTYTFRDTETDEVFDVFMSIGDMPKYLEAHPAHERYFGTDSAPTVVSGVSVKDRRDDGFKEVMSRIAEAHPNSELANQHGSKSIKQTQTERVVKKWKSAQ